mmetsp:Transcript_9186/g.6943  ORF Transcript_9186/g.6943 Transcript_9186/m.6943 type:complete len:112 (+) Transcript_9186:1021-1356(+)
MLDLETLELNQLIRLETSLPGIRFLLETGPEQMVAVDTEKTLKFYNFVDKNVKEWEEQKKQEQLAYQDIIRNTFAKYDDDQSGVIDFQLAVPFVQDVLEQAKQLGIKSNDQ